MIVKKKTWKQVQGSIKKLNSLFCKALEKDEVEMIWEVSVPFYHDIIQNGKWNLFDPSNIPSSLDAEFIQLFKSPQQPIGIIVDGICESYDTNTFIYGSNGKGANTYDYPLEFLKSGGVLFPSEIQKNICSGHHSIIPILPPKVSSSGKFEDVLRSWSDLNGGVFSSLEDSIPKVFPKILSHIGKIGAVSYTTKILLFPNTQEIDSFVQRIITETNYNELLDSKELIEIHQNLNLKSKRVNVYNSILTAQTLQYLKKATQGVKPVLKLCDDTPFDYLQEVRKQIYDIVGRLHEPCLLVFDYVDEKNGIFPSFSLPFQTNPATRIDNAYYFIRNVLISAKNYIEDDIIQFIQNNIHKKKGSGKSPKEFLAEKYGDSVYGGIGQMQELFVELKRSG